MIEHLRQLVSRAFDRQVQGLGLMLDADVVPAGHPRFERHVQAKSEQRHWLPGCQVVVSQVLRTYSDTRLACLLPIAATPPAG
jgi:hypothetical protein